MAKKIIFVHLLNDYSGSPKVLSHVINTVKKNGYDVVLYTGTSKDGFLSKSTSNHYSYFYKYFNNKYLTLITFMLSQLILFFKLLKYRNQDVVIYVNTLLPFGAGLAGKFLKKDVYYHIHETSIKPIIFKIFLRFIVQKTAKKVFFVSKFLQKNESFKNISQNIIYNGLSNNFTKVAKTNIYKFQTNGIFNVLMICSLKEYKGINEFINIARLCHNHNNIKFTLLLNADEFEISMYFDNIDFPKNVDLKSKQKDVIPFYKNASLVMNLSRIDQWIETFGLTILEAMAFGIPVIVPPVGGPTEIVRDNLDGYLISSYNINEIAKLIIELSINEPKCLFLSQNSRIRVEVFSEEKFEKNILKVLNE